MIGMDEMHVLVSLRTVIAFLRPNDGNGVGLDVDGLDLCGIVAEIPKPDFFLSSHADYCTAPLKMAGLSLKAFGPVTSTRTVP